MIKKNKLEPIYTATANGETLDITSLNDLMNDNGVQAGIVSTKGIVFNRLNQDGSIGELLGTITSYGHIHILIKKIDPALIELYNFYTLINVLVQRNQGYFGIDTRKIDTNKKNDKRDVILALNAYADHLQDGSVTFESTGRSIKAVINNDDKADRTVVFEFFSDGSTQVISGFNYIRNKPYSSTISQNTR